MKLNLLFSVWWLTASCGFSLTSSINSLFSSKSFMTLTIGHNNNEIVETISNGIQTAIDSCAKAFKWSRWNCPEVEFSRRRRQEATKEQAVIHAFASAGLTYAITKNCSRGNIPGCGCSNRNNKNQQPTYSPSNLRKYLTSPNGMSKSMQMDWTWGGCSDNVDYGAMLAQRILDEIEMGSDSQTNINLHNNQIGRTIVRDGMVKRCRCHGVSGSCSLQTCWMQLSPFVTTANKIRQMYGKATKFYLENRSSRSSPIATNQRIKGGHDKLVYIDESPDFCRFNNHTGWPGTKGRSCSRARLDSTTFGEKRSCKNLCRSCGYKVRKIKREVQWNCNCRFKWCCEVQCETCTEIVDEFLCQ